MDQMDALHEQQHRELVYRESMDAVLSAASLGLWSWDTKEDRIEWDATTYRIFDAQISSDRTVAEMMRWLHAEDVVSFQEVMRKISDGELTEAVSVECRIYHRDRSVHWVKLIMKRSSSPPLEYFVFGTVQPIDDQRRREEELARSNHELEQFAHITSHDLQEPLRNISHYTTKLVATIPRDQLTPSQHRYSAHIITGAEHMQNMIQSLLDYSRVDSKGQAFKWFNLRSALREAQESLMVTLRDHNATLDITENVPSLYEICGDQSQIVRMFMNLFQNAIKYARPDVKPLITVQAECIGGMFLIRVSDNGIGVELRHWTRVFEIFRQLDASSKSKGTGIGLTICRRIAQRHGGSIAIEKSHPGEGTTFLICLPETHQACGGNEGTES